MLFYNCSITVIRVLVTW